MKTINTRFRSSPHSASSPALHRTDPPSTLLTDFDVLENGEGRFLGSHRVLFAQYVLASNPKAVIAPEVSKPERQSPSFQGRLHKEGTREESAPSGSIRGTSEAENPTAFPAASRTP